MASRPAVFRIVRVEYDGTQQAGMIIFGHPNNKGVRTAEDAVVYTFTKWWANPGRDIVPRWEYIYAERISTRIYDKSKLWRTKKLAKICNGV